MSLETNLTGDTLALKRVAGGKLANPSDSTGDALAPTPALERAAGGKFASLLESPGGASAPTQAARVKLALLPREKRQGDTPALEQAARGKLAALLHDIVRGRDFSAALVERKPAYLF